MTFKIHIKQTLYKQSILIKNEKQEYEYEKLRHHDNTMVMAGCINTEAHQKDITKMDLTVKIRNKQ